MAERTVDKYTVSDLQQEVIAQYTPKDIVETMTKLKVGLARLYKMLHQYYNKEEKQIVALWDSLTAKDKNKIVEVLTYSNLLHLDTIHLPLFTYKIKKGKLVAGIKDGGILLCLEDRYKDTTTITIFPLTDIDWTIAGYGSTRLVDMSTNVAEYTFPVEISIAMEKMQFLIQKHTREGDKSYSIANHVMKTYGLATTISQRKRQELKNNWENNSQLFEEN